jgi:hypothetical protein
MKTAILILAISIAATLGFANKTFAQAGGNLFQISNQQAEGLGTVTITAPSGNYYLPVQGNSNASMPIPDIATSVTINGQLVPFGVKAIVTLPDGSQVGVLWTGPNAIAVIDKGELG